MSHIKNNRNVLLSAIGAVVVLVLVSVSLWNQVSKKQELKETHETLISELNTVENDIAKRQAELDKQKAVSVKKATGVDPALVTGDTEEAKQYFAPAFSWRSSEEYEKARNEYIESLGAKNTFTKTYLPPDTKIDTDDGPLSYIDFKGIRTTMDNIHIVPMKAEGDRIRYVAFVSYFMHKSDKDLANPDALEKSEAIIEFTAAGNSKDGGRRVTEVNARAGFRSSLIP